MRTTEAALDLTGGEGESRESKLLIKPLEHLKVNRGCYNLFLLLSTAMTYLSVCVLLEEARVVVNEAGELGMVQEENKQEKLLENEL